MGIDTTLTISSKWKLEDIANVLNHTQNQEATIEPCKDQPNCYNIFIGTKQIFVITNTTTPLGTATWLSLRSNDEAHKIFKDIASVLGGLFQASDYEGTYELIEGNINNNNGLPYFIQYAIVHDGINPNDLSSLLSCIVKWYQKVCPISNCDLRKLAVKLHNYLKEDK